SSGSWAARIRCCGDSRITEGLFGDSLAMPSRLSSAELSSAIYKKTEGVVGRICDLLKAAGAYAISSGIEKITIEVLERAGKSKWLQEIPANQK
ncbi:hypothetical protein LU640_24265, partial [Pseudomonas monteilii]|nr:hypothetical protein [Pseudomonas monteilii]MCE1038182.1 hypothetical protein [Pseudomonas monteilii]MCE1089747.1 hypothetical protein [Pseudomonas monteilii]